MKEVQEKYINVWVNTYFSPLNFFKIPLTIESKSYNIDRMGFNLWSTCNNYNIKWEG